MCGRYQLNVDREAFIRFYGFDPAQEVSQTRLEPLRGIDRDLDPFRPRYNVAPTTRVPVIRRWDAKEREIIRQGPGGERELAMAKWGLIPSWAKDPKIGNNAINARAEGIADKPMFRSAYKSRRCVVPASGFYEWKTIPGQKTKQPYLIRRRDGQPMSFAGLWEVWTDKATGEVVTSCTIITCGPNEVMAELHDRMPVILDPADIEAWLGVGGDAFLRPCPAAWLEAYPVSTKVNSVRNDGADLIEPADEADLFP